MAARGGRVALLAGAWVASALFAGWLLAPWLAARPVLPQTPAAEPGPGIAGTAPGGGTPPARRDVAGTPAIAATNAAVGAEPATTGTAPVGGDVIAGAIPPEALATGTVVVSVTRLVEGPVGDGVAYVLPAGAAAPQDPRDIIQAFLEDGRASLTVPAGQPLDVGVIGEFGTAMACDVAVAAGARIELELSPLRGPPITVECESPLEALGRDFTNAAVRFRPVREGLKLPGRGQAGALWGASAALDASGRGSTQPMPAGVSYDVYPMLVIVPTPDRIPPHYLVADPQEVAAGGHVRVRPERSARLTTRVSLAGPTPDSGALRIWLVGWRQPIWLWWHRLPMHGRAPSRSATQPDPTQDIVSGLPAGRYTVRWTGDHVEPGESEPVEIDPGEQAEARIVLRPASQPRAPRFDVPADPDRRVSSDRSAMTHVNVRFEGLPEDGEEFGRSVALYAGGSKPDGPGEPESLDPDPSGDGSYRWSVESARLARTPLAVAVAEADWASEPFDPRAGTSLSIQLRPAGRLLVVPCGIDLGDEPWVQIERLDGAPTPGGGQLRAAEPAITAGTILGPFPAGVMRFRAKRGGFVLGEVSAEVVAGQIRPLLLAR